MTKDRPQNTSISYLYRDRSNYKILNRVVVSGSITDEQKDTILSSLFDGEYFIPCLVGLPEERFCDFDAIEDGIFFELGKDSFELTSDAPTVDISIDKLVKAFVAAEKHIREGIWSLPPGHPCAGIADAMFY